MKIEHRSVEMALVFTTDEYKILDRAAANECKSVEEYIRDLILNDPGGPLQRAMINERYGRETEELLGIVTGVIEGIDNFAAAQRAADDEERKKELEALQQETWQRRQKNEAEWPSNPATDWTRELRGEE